MKRPADSDVAGADGKRQAGESAIHDQMGNDWKVVDGAAMVRPADKEVWVNTGRADKLAWDYAGFIWKVLDNHLFYLNPRGPGYTDDGMHSRTSKFAILVACVGAWDGKHKHEMWVEAPRDEDSPILNLRTNLEHIGVFVELASGGYHMQISEEGKPCNAEPVKSQWRGVPAVMPCGNHDLTSAVQVDKLIYVSGGALWWRGYPAEEHFFDELWAVDPTDLQNPAAWRVACKMPAKRAFNGLAALGRKLYVMGGGTNRDRIPNRRQGHPQLWIWDVDAETWENGPDMINAREECGAVVLGDRVYAIGWGKTMESIGAGDKCWRAEPDCPFSLGGEMEGQFGLCTLGNTMYVSGPFGFASFSAEKKWEVLASCPKAGGAPLMAAHKNEIWVMGGFFDDFAPGRMCILDTSAHSFNPETRKWTPQPSLPTAQAWGTAFSLGDSLLAIGGAHFGREARTFVFDPRVFELKA